MFLNYLYNDYNYVFVPIYFFISLIYQINYLQHNEIKKLFDKDFDDNENEQNLNFVMITKPNDLDDIIKNKNIFIKKYNSIENEQKYLNILTLRENIPWNADFYRPIHEIYLEYFVKTKCESYTIYKINTKTNDLIIHTPMNNSQLIIKNTIKNNFIMVANVLGYNKKYNPIDYDNWESLYNSWIKPIEPTDSINYEKIINIPIKTEQIIIDNITYTDITCFRNFIQKDFKSNLAELYSNNDEKENNLKKIPYLYTTYRIDLDSNIITILY